MDLENSSPDDLIEALGAREKETFADGGRTVKLNGGYNSDLPDGVSGGTYYVPAETPDGYHDWIEVQGSFRNKERERKATIYGRLEARTGFLEGAGNTVPVSVATDGQKAIAAYMWAVKGWDVPVIASKMDKAESTVRQYISDYKAERTE